MGVLQNIGVRVRSLIYVRAERFIKAEDERRREGLSERFNKKFIEFYNEYNLGDRGYEGFRDINARMLFDFYDKYGDKGLELLRFHEGVKLDYGDILNLRNFVQHCEIIENSDKGIRRGINLALRLVDEFSLDEIVKQLNKIKDPDILLVLNLRYKLEENEQKREHRENAYEKEEEFSDVEPLDEYENEYDVRENEYQVSSVDNLIAGAIVRSKEIESGKGMVLEKDLDME